MELKDYVRLQVEEALGPVNRWYCSEHYRREITEPNTLIEYYIKHGGAEGFAQRRRNGKLLSTPANDSKHLQV